MLQGSYPRRLRVQFFVQVRDDAGDDPLKRMRQSAVAAASDNNRSLCSQMVRFVACEKIFLGNRVNKSIVCFLMSIFSCNEKSRSQLTGAAAKIKD